MIKHHFTAEDRTTIRWANGTSTELFIYPSNGNFSERDFVFRISTATVETENSTFTFFEGITRHLMILKGSLDLIHEGHYAKHLEPFDQDTFSGEWQTTSQGKVTDFNLMLKNGATGSLKHYAIAALGNHSFTAKTDYSFIYIASGKAMINNVTFAESGDLIQFVNSSEIALQAKEDTDIITIEVIL